MPRRIRVKAPLDSLISRFLQRVTGLSREKIKPVEDLRWHFRVAQFLIRSIGGEVGKERFTFFRALPPKYAKHLRDLVGKAAVEEKCGRRLSTWLSHHDGVRPMRRDDLIILLRIVFDAFTERHHSVHVTIDRVTPTDLILESEVVDVLYHLGVLPDRVVEMLPESFVGIVRQQKLAM